MVPAPRRRAPDGFHDVLLPVLLWPARTRRRLEVSAFVSLAGPVGEQLLAPYSGYGSTQDERDAESLARALARVPAATRSAVMAAEAATEAAPSDEVYAQVAATALMGNDELAAWLGWARASVAHLVVDHLTEIEAVAAEMEAKTVISGRRMLAVMQSTHPQLGVPMPPPLPTNGDLSAAWFSPEQLARQRRDTEEEQRFARMLRRRARFDESLAQIDDPTPEQRRDLWLAADETPLMPRSKALKDAQGKALDASTLYEPVSSHGRVVNGAPVVYNRGHKLCGDAPAVAAASRLWIRADASDAEKATARKAHYDAALSDLPKSDDRYGTRILEPRKIPLERMVESVETLSKGPHFVRKGARHDVGDEIVRLEPAMFRYLDGSRLPREAA